MSLFKWRGTLQGSVGADFDSDEVDFGGGYTHYAPASIDPVKRRWPMVFEEPHDVMTQIEDFLEQHAGADFDFEDPRHDGRLYIVRCKSYNHEPINGNLRARIRATFEQVRRWP